MNLGKKEVLDQGFIELVDVMGTDRSIVQAARISYGENDTVEDKEKDRNLIRYLMRNEHTSPFEMCELKFLVRCPMDVWRQWIRHRTASVNEYSTRYKPAINACRKTRPNEWRIQSELNKQGSSKGNFVQETIGRKLSMQEMAAISVCQQAYEDRLQNGVAREQARSILPLSNYTEAYWKIDLHNLLHFLKLRMPENAQYEIRQYANAIYEITKTIFPVTMEAFDDYVLNSVKFSKPEIILIQKMLKGNHDLKQIIDNNRELINIVLNNKRESSEFCRKMTDIVTTNEKGE